MSASLGIFQQLSLLCRKELLTREAVTRASLPGRPTDEIRIFKSILKPQNDQSVGVRKRVKFGDVSSNGDGPKSEDGDIKISSEPSVALADKASKPESKDVHRSKKTYLCSVCNMIFGSKTKYTAHIMTDRHKGVVRCHLCVEKIPYNEMESHLNTAHSTSSPVFKSVKRLDDGHFLCTKCDIIFPMFAVYRKHTITLAHKGKACSLCSFRTQSPADLEKHYHSAHANRESCICKLCGAGFATIWSLERHMNCSHSTKRSYVCSSCTEVFSRRDNLQRHEEECHGTGTSFSCSICNLSFKYKRNLIQHLNIHVKNRYQCVICFRSFDDKSDFENHMKVHAGLPFNCMVCGMSFPNYLKRERHLATHLTNRKATRKGKEQKKDETDLKLDDSFCTCDPSPDKQSALTQTSHGENEGQEKCDNLEGEGDETCVSKTEKPKSCLYSSARNLSLSVPDSGQSTNQSDVLPRRDEVIQNFTGAESRKGIAAKKHRNIKKQNVNECAKPSEVFLKASTLPAEKCDKNPCNAEVGPELPSEVKKEGIVPSPEKNSVSFRECVKTSEDLTEKGKRKSPVLDIKDDNVSRDNVCKVGLDKVETPIFSVKNPENVKCMEDVPLERSTSVTLNKPHTGKRNFANAFENDLKQLSTVELRVKKRRKRTASKENSPVSGIKRVDKESFNVCLARKELKRKVGTNNLGAGLQGSVMPHNVRRKVPRIGNNDSDIKCDSNINTACESAIFSKALGTGECQIVEIMGNGLSKNDGKIMELTEDDLIAIDRSCYNSETWTCLDAAVEVLGDALFIDAEDVAELKGLITIPVGRDLAEADPLSGTHIVPDTDGGFSLLNTEDGIQNDILTFSAPEEILEANVSYQCEAVENCGKALPKKRKGKSEPTKRKNTKRTRVNENEVIVKILCTDSDNFCLPEFVIEDDSEPL